MDSPCPNCNFLLRSSCLCPKNSSNDASSYLELSGLEFKYSFEAMKHKKRNLALDGIELELYEYQLQVQAHLQNIDQLENTLISELKSV